MTKKIVTILLGTFLFLLPAAYATSFSLNFSDNEYSNYIENLTLNTTEATFGQTINIGLTTKNNFTNVSLTFSNGSAQKEVLLNKASENYYTGKIEINTSYTVGSYELNKINLDDQHIDLSDKKVKLTVFDLPSPTISNISNNSTSIKGIFLPNGKVQIYSNNKLVSTVSTNEKGEYLYNTKPLKEFTTIKVVGVLNQFTSKATLKTVADLIPPSSVTLNEFSDRSLSISGKSEPSSFVKVYLNQKLLGLGTTNSKGLFSVNIGKQKVGTLLQVVAIDKSNNKSKAVTVKVVDRTAPAAPTVVSLKENATIITGKTEANATVNLYLNNRFVLKTKSNNTGSYTFKVSKLKVYTDVKVVTVDLAGNQSKPSSTIVQSNQPISKNQLIIINSKTNKLSFYNQGKLVRTFKVATGKSSTPTPTGKFKIVNKIKNRPWYKEHIPGGDPRNPLGKRWMGLSVGASYGNSYGIHGNSNESSIGKWVSSGCIRMHNNEVVWLFDQVKVGTTVIIVKSSDSNVKIAGSYGIHVS